MDVERSSSERPALIQHDLEAQEQNQRPNAMLWACIRLLTEKAVLTRQLAHRTREQGDAARADEIDTL